MRVAYLGCLVEHRPSMSSCVVIQDEEYNHTLSSLTPLSLLTHPLRCPDVAIVQSSGRFVAWLPSERTAHPRPASAPRTHHLGPLRKTGRVHDSGSQPR